MKEPNKTKVPYRYKDDRKRNDFLNKGDSRNKDKDLPGNYPREEDIMNRRDVERADRGEGYSSGPHHGRATDVDRLTDEKETPNKNIDDLEKPANEGMERPVYKDRNVDEDKLGEDQRNDESDVTEDDLQALGPRNLSPDMDIDINLWHIRPWPIDMSGKDLDIPRDPDANDKIGESIGPRDEENDFYSLGGDRHEDNLEGK